MIDTYNDFIILFQCIYEFVTKLLKFFLNIN